MRSARFNRSDIRANVDGSARQAGIPLTLNVRVLDAQRGCAPYGGAQIDIWHCNATGVYSDQPSQNTANVTWLRGYQVTNAAGLVTFRTIVPGWYEGRATHIHLRVRSRYGSASSPDGRIEHDANLLSANPSSTTSTRASRRTSRTAAIRFPIRTTASSSNRRVARCCSASPAVPHAATGRT